MVIISVAGTQPGVGVTHTCISLATALRQKCYPSEGALAFLKRNKSNCSKITVLGDDSLRDMGIELGRIKEDEDDTSFSHNGITYVTKRGPISSFRREGVEFLIIDCGLEIGRLETASYPILVSGSRPWNMASDPVYKAMEEVEETVGLENAILAFPFASDKTQKELKRNLGEESLCIFPGFETDPLADSLIDISFIKEAVEDLSISHEHEIAEIKDKFSSKLSSLEEEIQKRDEEIRSREEEIERKKKEASTDLLTGCGNRTAFENDIKVMPSECVIVFDINDLKIVNDTLGHSTGDQLISVVAGEIKALFPSLYRVGGDEFYALCEDAQAAELKLKGLDDAVSAHVFGDRAASVSFGLARFSETDSKREAIELADNRMYEDKKSKKPEKVEVSEELMKVLEDEAQIEALVAEKEKLLAEKEETLAGLTAQIEENKTREEELTKVIEEGLAEYGEDCIPYAPMEPDEAETSEYKLLSSMWFGRIALAFTKREDYEEITVHVFPLSFVKPPYRLPLVTVVEHKGEYSIVTGRTCTFRIGKTELSIRANFTKDGDFDIGCYVDDDAEIKSRKDIVINKGSFTPKHFGKVINMKSRDGFVEYELFPVEKNSNGTYESVMVRKLVDEYGDPVINDAGDEELDAFMIHGRVETDNGPVSVICDDKRITVMPE